MGKNKKGKKKKIHSRVNTYQFLPDSHKDLTFTIRKYSALTDLSEIVTKKTAKGVTPDVSLTRDPVFATALEAMKSGKDHPAIVVPIIRNKKTRKAIKHNKVFQIVSAAYNTTAAIDAMEMFNDTTPETDIGVLKAQIDVAVPVGPLVSDQNSNIATMLPIFVVFVLLPENLVQEGPSDDNIPDDYVDMDVASGTTRQDIVVMILSDILKRFGCNMMSVFIDIDDTLYDTQGSTKRFFEISAFIASYKKIFGTKIFAKYIEAAWLNTPTIPVYSSIVS